MLIENEKYNSLAGQVFCAYFGSVNLPYFQQDNKPPFFQKIFIDGCIDEVHEKLKEIYAWNFDNLSGLWGIDLDSISIYDQNITFEVDFCVKEDLVAFKIRWT